MRLAACLLLASCALICPVAAAAQTRPPSPPSGVPKDQPPPLFPKHRRGLYTNNDKIEVIDATPQSPPLDTDDPSVPDKGEYEINILTSADLSSSVRRMDVPMIDANYGIVIKGFGHELPTQIKFEAPITVGREGNGPYTAGIGDATFGLKFNFYNDERRGLGLAVYPQVEFSSHGSAEKGLAERGQTIEVPFLVEKELKYATLVGNAEIDRPVHDPDRETGTEFGLGVGRAFYRKLAVMVDVRESSSLDFRRDRAVWANVGAIYGVRKTIWYARLGRTFVSEEGPRTFVGFGIKLLIG